MKFQYYDPKRLVPLLIKLGLPSDSAVCQGCVITDIPPEYCIHSAIRMVAPEPIQSDILCDHCATTVEEEGEPFHLHEDKSLPKRVRELEAIIEMSLDKKVL